MKEGLKTKERLFCRLYAAYCDAETAAKEAGYKEPFTDGQKLLCRTAVIAEIRRLARERGSMFSQLAMTGYRRLAFGGISDAVSLLLNDELTPERLRDMDLFLVSEIRKPKDGAIEIKFFDRLKALEKLEQGGGDVTEARSLFDAIGRSAEGSAVGEDEALD